MRARLRSFEMWLFSRPWWGWLLPGVWEELSMLRLAHEHHVLEIRELRRARRADLCRRYWENQGFNTP